MVIRIVSLVLIFAFPLSATRAQSGLEPDTYGGWGGASEHTLIMSELFGHFLPFGSRNIEYCRDGSEMILNTSFRSERFAATCQFQTGYLAVAAEPERPIWLMLNEDQEVTWRQVARDAVVRWDSAPLDSTLACDIGDLWSRAIRSATMPTSLDISFDGEVASFRRIPLASPTGPDSPAPITATAANAQPEMVAGAMQALGLRIAAFARNEATEADIRDGMETLASRLAALGL